jgi:tRNA(fMet)-specific endonuclease VapC
MKAGGKTFLDTNIVIEIFKNNEKLKQILAGRKFSLSVVVIAELLFGAENSTHTERHTQQVTDFIDLCRVVEINYQTAIHYSKIKANLRKIGNPIPENDIWIAASCLEQKSILITKDRHFTHIKGLMVELIE